VNYSELVSRLVAAAQIAPETDDTWPVYLPNIIEMAEARCYRDVSFLASAVVSTVPMVPSISQFPAPAGWLVGERLSVKVGSMFQTLDRRDASYLLEVDDGLIGPPRFWAEPMAGQIVVYPAPDQAYLLRMEYEGRPPALSEANTTTWLATFAPDLFFAACMSAVTGFQKNFGAQADNPQAAMSWEAMYGNALKSVLRQEGRRKGDGTFDSTTSPPPPSNAPQGG
jgi:hypothetical protein